METLNISPRGTIEEAYNWNTKEVKFESGISQRQRRWTKPLIQYKISTEGGADDRKYFIDFYNARCGNFEAFYCVINGEKKTVRFVDSSLSVKTLREYRDIIGYRVEFTLEEVKNL